MGGEPVDAGGQQVPHQGDRDQYGGGQRHPGEGGAQEEPVQGVGAVRQRAHGVRAGGRGGQQRGGRALPADRPEPFGDAEDEDRHQEGGQGRVRGPVDPERGDDQQGGPQAVGDHHRPAPVERAAGCGQ